MIKKYWGVLVIAICFTMNGLYAQDYSFGIRAGLNYSKLIGPQINTVTEKDAFQFNNGLHFGVTFAYHLTDNFGLRTELAYNQIGTLYTYQGENSPFVFRYGQERVVRNGKIERFFDISNSYIHVPLMVYYKPHRKVELYGGIYAQFLIIPTANGRIDMTAPENSETPGELFKYSFEQLIEANYFSDDPREVKGSQSLIVDLIIDGETEKVAMNRLVGGYYELDADEKKASLYNWFDAGLEFGGSYYINRSLYLGLTGMYGLTDVTNNKADVDFGNLNEFQKYIFRSDFDRNLSLQLSLGFNF